MNVPPPWCATFQHWQPGCRKRKLRGLDKDAPKRPPNDYVPPRSKPVPAPAALPPETGGPKGPEPTRYGDWELKGIAVDF
jgi:hypothetical protein